MIEAKEVVCPGPDCKTVFIAKTPKAVMSCCGRKLCTTCSTKKPIQPSQNKYLCILCNQQTTLVFDVKTEPKESKGDTGEEPEVKRQKLDSDQSPEKSLEEMFVEKFLAAKAKELGEGKVTEVEKKKFLDVLEKKLNAMTATVTPIVMTATPTAMTTSEEETQISGGERSVQEMQVDLASEKTAGHQRKRSFEEISATPTEAEMRSSPAQSTGTTDTVVTDQGIPEGPVVSDSRSLSGSEPPASPVSVYQRSPKMARQLRSIDENCLSPKSPIQPKPPSPISGVVDGLASPSVIVTNDRKTPPSSVSMTNDRKSPPSGLLTPPSSRDSSSPSSGSTSPAIGVRAEFNINNFGPLVKDENTQVNEALRNLGLPIQFFGETLAEKRYRLEEASKLLAPIIPNIVTPEVTMEKPKTPTPLLVDQFLKGMAAIHVPEVLEVIQQTQDEVSPPSIARKPISPPHGKQPERTVSLSPSKQPASEEEKEGGVWIRVEDLSMEEKACLPKHARMNGLVSKRKIQEWLKGAEEAKAETTAETNSLGGYSDKSSNSDKESIVNCPCGNKCVLAQCTEFKNMFPAAKREFLTRAILCWNCFKLGHETDDCEEEEKDIPKNQSAECMFCFLAGHTMLKCPLFFYMPVEEQRAFLAAQSICYNCFRTGHKSRDCPNERACELSDCTLFSKHHPRAHDYHKPRKVNYDKKKHAKEVQKLSKIDRGSGPCMYCNSTEHRIEGCPKFEDIPLRNRVRFVATRKICFNCFGKGHTYTGCKYPKACLRDGCKVKLSHHTFFHEHF